LNEPESGNEHREQEILEKALNIPTFLGRNLENQDKKTRAVFIRS